MPPLHDDRTHEAPRSDPRTAPPPRREFARRIDCAEGTDRRGMAAGARGRGAPDPEPRRGTRVLTDPRTA